MKLTRRYPHADRCRGSVLSEAVLIIPLIAMLLAMLFYFGHLVVRAQDTSVMTRYETWRQVARGPAPGANHVLGHPQLNDAFHRDKATSISHGADNFFPEEPYEEMLDVAGETSPDAQTFTEAYLYRPNEEHRNSRGRQDIFGVKHDSGYVDWQRLSSVADRDIDNPEQRPITRRHVRIGTDWTYTNNWRASADEWGGGGASYNHLRATRDAFYLEFDRFLDAVDGSRDPEYGDGESEVPGNSLAGEVRQLYLRAPGYRGPKF